MSGDLVVMCVTDQDARAAGTTRQLLAQEHVKRTNTALESVRRDYRLKSLILDAVYSMLAIAALVLLLGVLGMVFRHLCSTLDS